MSTIDTSTWNPDADLNVEIEGIPLNSNASIQQTWQAIQMLMAALKGDTAEIKLTINQPDGTTIVATNQTLTVVDNGHAHTIANVSGLQTALDGKADDAAVVHLAGDETISGAKTFSTNPAVSGSGGTRFECVVSGNPTSSRNWRVWFGHGNSGSGGIYDATRSKYIFERAASSGDVSIRAYPDSGSPTKTLVLKNDGTATWDGQAIQTTSDERLKTPLGTVPDEVLDAWGDVGWGQFQFLEAVGEKGTSARLHLGLIAQRVKAAFESRGLDACVYGILCYAEDADIWMVRYAEALAMEAAFQRRRADRLEARIATLEVKLNG